MRGKSHFVFGIGSGLLTAVASPAVSLLHLPIVGVASLLPDIDSSSSTLGKQCKLIAKMFKHRGFLHTPLFLSLFFLIQDPGLRWSFVIGIASHIFLDMFNAGGIMFFYPFSKRKFKLAKIKSGSWIERILIVLLLITEGMMLFCLPTVITNFNIFKIIA